MLKTAGLPRPMVRSAVTRPLTTLTLLPKVKMTALSFPVEVNALSRACASHDIKLPKPNAVMETPSLQELRLFLALSGNRPVEIQEKCLKRS